MTTVVPGSRFACLRNPVGDVETRGTTSTEGCSVVQCSAVQCSAVQCAYWAAVALPHGGIRWPESAQAQGLDGVPKVTSCGVTCREHATSAVDMEDNASDLHVAMAELGVAQ